MRTLSGRFRTDDAAKSESVREPELTPPRRRAPVGAVAAGALARRVGSHELNRDSSRSHSICTAFLEVSEARGREAEPHPWSNPGG